MQAIDQNNDGSISCDEFLDGMARLEGAMGFFSDVEHKAYVGKQEEGKNFDSDQNYTCAVFISSFFHYLTINIHRAFRICPKTNISASVSQ